MTLNIMCNFFHYYGYTHCRRALEMAEIRKSDLINIVFYHTVNDIRMNVRALMDNIMLDTMKIIDRLCVWMKSGSLVNH